MLVLLLLTLVKVATICLVIRPGLVRVVVCGVDGHLNALVDKSVSGVYIIVMKRLLKHVHSMGVGSKC